jgi:hypothetical protein
MTQTALELDHEENLRFSARRAIHAGIFGETAGPMKVTDYPPEFHEAKRGGKLRPKPTEQRKKEPFVTAKPHTEAELTTFMEAEEQARLRPQTLKELAISRGNDGHEVVDGDDYVESVEDPAANATGAGHGERELRQSLSNTSDKHEKPESPPKREKPEDDVDASEVKRKAAKIVEATASPDDKKGDLMFARVALSGEDGVKVSKARVTGVVNDKLEVVREGTFETLSVGLNDINLIDETQFIPRPSAPKDASKGPSDFSFLLNGKADKQTPKK